MDAGPGTGIRSILIHTSVKLVTSQSRLNLKSLPILIHTSVKLVTRMDKL